MKRYKVMCPLVSLRIQKQSTEPTELTIEEVRKLWDERERELVTGIELVDGVKVKRVSKEYLKEIDFGALLPSYGKLSSVRFILEKTTEDSNDNLENYLIKYQAR